MPSWTQNQKNAINSVGGSVLVSASAGSGKTAVLVERVISRITNENNPTPADRMLIVTYTKLAAAEMKERVNKRLSELIKADPYNTHLRRQKLKLNNAHISTIHSFCSDLVREYFYILGVSKDFRIAEEGELEIIKNQAVKEVLDKQYERDDKENFINLVESFSGNKNDSNIEKVIFSLYEFLRSHPFPHQWLEEKLQYYSFDKPLSQSVWAKVIFEYSINALNQALLICELNRGILQNTDDFLAEVLTPVYESDVAKLSQILTEVENQNWDLVRNLLSGFKAVTMPRKYKDHPDKNAFSENRKDFKNIIDKLKGLFIDSEKECVEDIKKLYPVVKEMFNLVTRFGNTFEEMKNQKNVLDFSDLEHLTLKLLVKGRKNGVVEYTEEAKKIASKFDEVMVDEYQDANEVQDIIFKALSGDDDHLFVVGDVKQSIYSFRQAMPDIFIGRKNSYPLYDENKDNYPSRIILEKNFRSRKQVTDTVNFMFKRLMSEECGDIEYNQEETLVCGADYNEVEDTKISLSLIDLEMRPDVTEVEAESDHIAQQIHKIMAEKTVNDKGNIRKPLFKDFAIIMRSTKKYANDYCKRLKQWGIPAVSSVSDTFLSNREVRIIVDLLRVIDNPLQDIPLLSVLMGPLYGFTADEMAEIRSNDRHRNIYLSLKTYSEKSEKAQNFLSDIERFRTYSAIMPVGQLINKIYEETFYPAILKGMFQTELPYNNILLLKDYATTYESNGAKGLSSFVNYIDTLISQGSDLPSGKDNSTADLNAVQVLSIHGSKGLEYPFVFLANTGRKFVTDTSQNVLLHKDLGFSLKIRDIDNSVMYNTLPRVATSIAMRNSEKSEELRILYVALTRAREELHMVVTNKKMYSYVNKIGRKLINNKAFSPYVVSEASKLSDWLVMCALAHKDGEKLRQKYDVEGFESYDYNAPDWDIICVDNSEEEYTTTEDNTDVPLERDILLTDSYIDNIIQNRLNFNYKNKGINNIPLKVSVSEISHKDSKERFSKVLSRPDFMSEKSMSPTERGTAVHNTLQYIDFKKAKENLEEEIESLVKSGYISEKQSKVLDHKKLQNLLNSEIIADVISSEKVYREFRFNTKIKATEAFEVEEKFRDIDIILQGSVDLAYLKNGRLNVVDYKTDRVKSSQELVELYSKQLRLYKDAMEQCTPYKVENCIIYSIHLGEFVYV